MKNIIFYIIAIFVFSCITAKQIPIIEDLDIKIQKGIEVLKSDSLFKYELELNHGTLTGFFIEDSTYIPYVTTSIYKRFYPKLSNKSIIDKYNNYQEVYSIKNPYIKVVDKLSKFQNKENSNYKIIVGFIESNLICLHVSPLLNQSKNGAIQIFLLFDEHNSVIDYLSSKYWVSD